MSVLPPRPNGIPGTREARSDFAAIESNMRQIGAQTRKQLARNLTIGGGLVALSTGSSGKGRVIPKRDSPF